MHFTIKLKSKFILKNKIKGAKLREFTQIDKIVVNGQNKHVRAIVSTLGFKKESNIDKLNEKCLIERKFQSYELVKFI